MNKIIVIFCACFVIAGVGLVYNSAGSGPGDDPPMDESPPVDRPTTRDKGWQGAVYARIRSQNFIAEKLIFGMEIKAFPPIKGKNFPTIGHQDFQNEINIHAMVRLRYGAAPENVMNDGIRLKASAMRRDTHQNIERSEKNFDALMARLIAIRGISDTFILRNVETETDKYGKRFVADIYFRTGGLEFNLFDNLFVDNLIHYRDTDAK